MGVLFSPGNRREKMATKFKYRRSVTHRCGHSEHHVMYAHNRQEADSWAHNLRKVDCPKCRDSNLSRDTEIKEASRNADFPDLYGSSGQVAWAGALRSRIYGALTRSERYQVEAHLCRYETSAVWWIDHRADRLGEIISHLRDLERNKDVAA
jgi:hypothetical protein